MKILLVEPGLELGEQIQQSLSQEHYIVDWFQDGLATWSYLEYQPIQYTVAIFDWMMPGLPAVALCQRLRTQHPLPVLVLTPERRWQDGVLALDAGADDYLVKPFRMQELLARLRALRRRSPQYQPLQLQFGRLSLDCNHRIVSWCSNPTEYEQVRLSKKEFQVLEYLMRQPKQEASQEQLLNYLYEMESERVSNVVAAQIRRLRCKLAELGCEDVIETVQGGNYRLNPVYIDYSIEQSESIS